MNKTLFCLIASGALAIGCSPPSGGGETRAANEVPAPFEPPPAEPVTWLTDFGAAKKAAADRRVPILASFSGSDWCSWCMRLDEEVFSRDEFKTFANDSLVLFVADFPARKEQPEDVKRQNRALAKEYGVEGYPTVLLLDATGRKLAKTGYRQGGAEAYVEHIKALAAGRG